MRTFLRYLPPALGALLFVAAAHVLHHELAVYRYGEVVRALRGFALPTLLAAVGCTVLGYAALAGYDALALRHGGRRLSLGRALLAPLVAYGLSQTMGFPLLTAGAVRYRMYSSWGLTPGEIGRVVAFTAATFWLGILVLGGGALVADPAGASRLFGLHALLLRVIGLLSLLLGVGYIVLSVALRGRVVRLGFWEFLLPKPSIAAMQLAVSVADWAAAGCALYVLLSPGSRPDIAPFLGAFVTAQAVGVVSHVPGGLGVFEAAFLLLGRPHAPAGAMLASLIAYRVIYYLLPFAAAVALLTVLEVRRRRAVLAHGLRTFGDWIAALAPRVLAVSTFMAGVVLLVSGATPALGSRLTWIHRVFPLGIIEVSHFVGSLVGFALLLLARGLQRRLDAAYHLTVGLLAVGIVASLFKGWDYEEAVILTTLLAALLVARRHFYRRAALTAGPFGRGWVIAIGVAILASTYIGFFVHKHVQYSSELWWHFALRGDAPRFLRAQMGVLGAAALVALARLLRPARRSPRLPTAADVARAQPIIAQSPRAVAHLALVGDKTLLFNDAGTAFLMYGVAGRTWVACGDPVGPPNEHENLVWRFRELADARGAQVAFYEVGAALLPLYLDLGLTPHKLGEEARVPLASYSLEGGSRHGLRRTRRQVVRAGSAFAVLPAEQVPSVLDEIHLVSDAWLAAKQGREKGFSLGRFDPEYLRCLPLAVVRQGSRIVAFANLWPGGEREELSIDLMRYSPDAPPGVMEYLLIELMLWGKAEGYRYFNLGIAPLSGLQPRRLAPVWTRLSALMFKHGELLYRFHGLRAYKEKFDPQWTPVYLASHGWLGLPRLLADIAMLISGGRQRSTSAHGVLTPSSAESG